LIKQYTEQTEVSSLNHYKGRVSKFVGEMTKEKQVNQLKNRSVMLTNLKKTKNTIQIRKIVSGTTTDQDSRNLYTIDR
jgi:hypothetical protein